jgi:succinate dehydrogenase/fumarate reductase-like Fe-S protein
MNSAGISALRWNCKAGKCGSCSMEINGKPRLSCMTRMNTFAEAEHPDGTLGDE